MAATRSRISVEEYLALPHDEPPWLEYYRGEVIEKPLPNPDHSVLAGRPTEALVKYRNDHGGILGVEGRTRFDDASEPPSFLLPDISFHARGARFRDGQMLLPPTLAMEIMSPGQSRRAGSDRAAYFLDHGVQEVWIVHPSIRAITVCDGTGELTVTGDGAAISASVSGFRVELPWLFAVMDNDIA